MKKIWMKILILTALFFVAVSLFEVVFATGKKDLTTTMAKPTLPTITMKYKERELNLLTGYTTTMDVNYIRSTITPVELGGELGVEMISHEQKITKLNYEVRSLDGTRLIMDGDLTEQELKGEVLTAQLKVPEILQKDEEYLLHITVTADGEGVNYYTRIIDDSNSKISECIDFAKLFHEDTLDDSKVNDLKKYMETNSTSDNTSLSYVDIHSTMTQLSWGEFSGSVLNEPLVSVQEIASDYCVVTLTYVMTSKESGGVTLYYNIEENYRIKVTESRTYLLDYSRTMNEMFRGENSEFTSKKLNLGIRDEGVEYRCNENGKSVSFVQEGELWNYNVDSGVLARVFSFKEFEGVDLRQNRDDFQINVLRVNEAGSTDFVVVGYMNRGKHEGKVGVALYHYDSVANTIEEELWLPTDRSYSVIAEELGEVLYANDYGEFYMAFEGAIYQVDLTNMSTKILASNNGNTWYKSSENGNRIAWTSEGDINSCTTMTVMDLDTGEVFKIEANEDEYLKPLGFLDDDLIYGRTKIDQIITDGAGNSTYPMYQIQLLNSENQVIKTYSKEGYYTTDIMVQDFTIYLNRITIENKQAKVADVDTIMNITGDAIFPVMVTSMITRDREKEILLQFDSGKDVGKMNVLTPKLLLTDKESTVKIDLPKINQDYYVYKNGKVIESTMDVSKAVTLANEEEGVVIDSYGSYIWTRSKAIYVSTPNGSKVDESLVGTNLVERCLSVMIGEQGLQSQIHELIESGSTPKQVLEEALSDVTVLDLTGCSSEEVLYYVSQGTSVYGITSEGKPVLIVGYGSTSYTLYYPEINRTQSVSREQMEVDFEQSGNVFLTYMKK